MKNKTISLILILTGIYITLRIVNVDLDNSIINIIAALVYFLIAIKFVLKRNFFMFFTLIFIDIYILRDYIGLGQFNVFLLIFPSIIFSTAFSLMFPKVKCNKSYNNYSTKKETINQNGHIIINNRLGSKTKFLQSSDFRGATINNELGECSVYFNDVIINELEVSIHVNGTLGQTNLYIPSKYQVNVNTSEFLGSVSEMPSINSDGPIINITGSITLGELRIIRN